MKNKGFTLVELLAIVVLLGILVIIVFPAIMSNIESKQTEIDKSTLEIIYSSTDEYMKDNSNLYGDTLGATYCISIADINDGGYFPIDVDKYLDKKIQVKIGDTNSYSLVDTCGGS